VEGRMSPDQQLQHALAQKQQGRTLVLYTDGFATTSPVAAGWGWLALDPVSAAQPCPSRTVLAECWGPVVLDPEAPGFLGVEYFYFAVVIERLYSARATKNSGELSAMLCLGGDSCRLTNPI